MLALKAENISKQYRLGQVGTGTLSHDLNRFWHQVRGKEDPYLKIGEANDRASKGESEYVWSLRDINFEIEQGDAVGIIGRNGAGKSTLLKLLSKVTKPTTGKIYTNGRIASLLEVGTGFHPEMTGRENIYLNGAILGMTRKEINCKFDEIVDFSGVERYIDTPVKRYSSGMYVRLAFAVAAHLESEILIVDEVLAVGDAEFQKKCLGKMGDVSKGEGRTVLFVSHDLNAVSQLCNTGILLHQGLVEYTGKIRETVSTYLNADNDEVIYFNNKDTSGKKMFIKQIEVVKNDGTVSKEYSYDEPINFKFNICMNETPPNCSFFVTILDSRKRRVFSCERQSVNDLMTLTIDPRSLVRGKYSIHAFINQPKVAQLDVAEDVCKFIVTDSASYLSKHGEYDYGSVFGRYKWNEK
ncbi:MULTISPECIES: polysaccharide ABC transporter ATP-binding protein [unclassified Kaistella]|uniref:ABC transporter ATP-binding protein n=1 Tax=unclassified Kaistella TaxID=2762626 RepID=UPI0027366E15|nr:MULTISPECIES: polysaccharide ABC transporter ATP-binding protein [unclassified Kaistella]MDP2454927.1 polysaccharide ABC transporter ATP-binding protein [Kaistella sp. SH11-4b]MDP2456090.1 polysaccharide ABC transporter ATP-binding protein [Kaistella sp. SH40-3]MDP2460597.1 polysaccharide ABC transporter ATP-binding protein [Kaistella sp. SH19-2b]